ncbi:NfeD family protein [Ruminococcus sp.]|jgi:membrane protein implicated in regulation of membrane protease activity|uniref:NfeD family protein n=1 Tax=Ruminococcus sp. TaxID=41978 RepID=UPI001B0165D8|nr:NfeD family protein [Ruminococcus sp.]MBE6873110.1 NfeD family protein [Ruminococcus albus]MBO5559658.1 NfeD family protein [Ruminococcus sp.]
MTATACIIVWAVAFVFFVVVEIANGAGLLSIWFALGSLAAMFCAIAKLPFVAQFAVFVLMSIIFLIATRPLARKVQKTAIPTNFELDVGKTAQVIEGIDNSQNKGRVKLDGTDWSAVSADGSRIPVGAIVRVVEVSGAKLIVEQQK